MGLLLATNQNFKVAERENPNPRNLGKVSKLEVAMNAMMVIKVQVVASFRRLDFSSSLIDFAYVGCFVRST